jgi:hypothetical protein
LHGATIEHASTPQIASQALIFQITLPIRITPTKSSIPLNYRSNALTPTPIFKLATISKHKYKYRNLTLIVDALSGTELALSTKN